MCRIRSLDVWTSNLLSLSPVKLKENNNTLIEFNHNFSSNRISLGEIIIQKYNTSNKGQLLIKGLNLSSGTTKIAYIDRINNNSNFSSLCIKDSEVFDISEISSSCDESDETLINCPGTSGSYTCSAYVTSGNNQQWKITGLTHSAITQSCTESWSCGSWSSCTSSTQTRTCADSNNCGTVVYRPSTNQSCTSGTTSSGGSSSSEGVPYTATPESTYVDINNPVEKEIKKGEIIQFTINEENHSITAKRINETEITLEIQSTPFETIIQLGETKEFDLNENEEMDLSIKIKELSSTIATLVIKNVEKEDNNEDENILENSSEQIISNQENNLSHEVTNLDEKDKNLDDGDQKENKNTYAIILVLTIGIIVGLFLFMKKNKPIDTDKLTEKEQELIAYIKNKKEKNISESTIREELTNAGWSKEEINKCLK